MSSAFCEDPRKGFVKGMITVGPAKTETDVTHYTIFWASNKTTMDLIISLPVGIYEHNLVSPENEQKGVPTLSSNQSCALFLFATKESSHQSKGCMPVCSICPRFVGHGSVSVLL